MTPKRKETTGKGKGNNLKEPSPSKGPRRNAKSSVRVLRLRGPRFGSSKGRSRLNVRKASVSSKGSRLGVRFNVRKDKGSSKDSRAKASVSSKGHKGRDRSNDPLKVRVKFSDRCRGKANARSRDKCKGLRKAVKCNVLNKVKSSVRLRVEA